MEVNSMNWCTRKRNSARIDVGRGKNDETQVEDMSEEQEQHSRQWSAEKHREKQKCSLQELMYRTVVLEKELSRLVMFSICRSAYAPTLTYGYEHCVDPTDKPERNQLWWHWGSSLEASRHVPLGGDSEGESGHAGRLWLLALEGFRILPEVLEEVSRVMKVLPSLLRLLLPWPGPGESGRRWKQEEQMDKYTKLKKRLGSRQSNHSLLRADYDP